MLTSNKLLLVTALLASTLTACDKKAPAKTDTTSATSASTTTVTTTENTSTVNTTADSTPTSTVSSLTPTQANSSVANSGVTVTEIPPLATPVASSTTSVKFPTTHEQSIVTQAVKAGTPEATIKSMMDAMMTGTPQQVASYYGVDDPDVAQALADQQPMVQQQLKHLQLGTVEYNKDKSKAIIVGKMTLKDNTNKEVGYKLQKIKGEWKLMP